MVKEREANVTTATNTQLGALSARPSLSCPASLPSCVSKVSYQCTLPGSPTASSNAEDAPLKLAGSHLTRREQELARYSTLQCTELTLFAISSNLSFSACFCCLSLVMLRLRSFSAAASSFISLYDQR